MRKRGKIVETKSDIIGRTLSGEKKVNGKIIVHAEKNGKPVRLLCDSKTLKLIGRYD